MTLAVTLSPLSRWTSLWVSVLRPSVGTFLAGFVRITEGVPRVVERTISVTCVAAIGLWVTTFLLIFAGAVVGLVSGNEHGWVIAALMASGLGLSAAAATASIRLMIRRQNRLLTDAFEFGREARGGGVRSMRP